MRLVTAETMIRRLSGRPSGPCSQCVRVAAHRFLRFRRKPAARLLSASCAATDSNCQFVRSHHDALDFRKLLSPAPTMRSKRQRHPPGYSAVRLAMPIGNAVGQGAISAIELVEDAVAVS